MEEGSFGSVSLGWLLGQLSQTEPASTTDITERCPRDRYLGTQSDAELRMKALHRRLKKNDSAACSLIPDSRMREDACVALEKLILFERRMVLGENATGVDRFKVYGGGEIGQYVKVEKRQ